MRRSLIVQTSLLLLIALSCFSEASRANILDLFYDGISSSSRKAASALHQQHPAESADASADVMANAKAADANANSANERQTSSAAQSPPEDKSCTCEERVCTCCVDFNVTFIDLGGPGCVKMKYLSQDEGVLLDVSYGDSLLRSAVATSTSPSPICVNILSHIAEVCARFTSLSRFGSGLKGCLKLEPTLLGDVQTQFRIGCFIMNNVGMRMDQEHEVDEEEEVDAVPAANSTSLLDGISSEDLLAVVNESAQKGLALFQNWLGIGLKNATAEEDEAPTQQEKRTESQSRSNVLGNIPMDASTVFQSLATYLGF